MKKILPLLAMTLLFGYGYSQPLTKLIPDSMYAGQQFVTMQIVGSNMFTGAYRIYSISLYKPLSTQNPIIIDDNFFINAPFMLGDTASVYYFYTKWIPINADTGYYNLVVERSDTATPGTISYYDTLFNALKVFKPDGYARGKIFIDNNLNKIFDAGDSLVTQSLTLGIDTMHNYEIDSSGNYVFAVMNGPHRIKGGVHDYVLTTDSSSYTFLVNNADVNGLDFGLTLGIVSSTPDTVRQLDSVQFDVHSRGLFPTANVDGISYYKGNIDSITFAHWNITYIDSNYIQTSVTLVSADTGWYDMVVYLYLPYATYHLKKALYILPPLNTSLATIEKDAYGIFPNPTTTTFTIKNFSSLEKSLLQIFNPLGEIVYSEKLAGKNEYLINAKLGKGIYFVQVSSREKRMVRKLVVE